MVDFPSLWKRHRMALALKNAKGWCAALEFMEEQQLGGGCNVNHGLTPNYVHKPQEVHCCHSKMTISHLWYLRLTPRRHSGQDLIQLFHSSTTQIWLENMKYIST